jgi:hypothetical protein
MDSKKETHAQKCDYRAIAREAINIFRGFSKTMSTRSENPSTGNLNSVPETWI